MTVKTVYKRILPPAFQNRLFSSKNGEKTKNKDKNTTPYPDWLLNHFYNFIQHLPFSARQVQNSGFLVTSQATYKNTNTPPTDIKRSISECQLIVCERTLLFFSSQLTLQDVAFSLTVLGV